MLNLMILALLGIVYVLIVVPWRMPLFFRLFLLLIVSWPVLSLYLKVSLPAGVPDLHYHRGYVALLLAVTVISAVFARRRASPSAMAGVRARRLAPSVANLPNIAHPVGPELSFGGRFPKASTAPSNSFADSSNRPKRTSPQFVWFPIPVIAYVLLSGAALMNGLDSIKVANYLDCVLLPVAMYVLTKKLIVSRRRLEWMFGAFILAAFIVCLTGLYERVLDLTESAFPIKPFNAAGDTRYLGVPGGRAAGVMANPGVYGGLMGMGVLACLTLLVHCSRTWKKLLLGGVALLLAYGVFVSYTRAAWISVAFALLFAQFYFKGLWKVTMPLALCCGLVVAFAWGGLQQNDVVQERVMNEDNVTGRVDRIIWSWERFLERPVLGRGPGALNRLISTEFPVDGFSSSHNTYMTMLVDNGVLVFASFWAVVFIWLAKANFVLRFKPHGQFEHSVIAAMVGFLAIWLLSGMSMELSYYPYYTSLFWMAGAIIERLSYQFETSTFSHVASTGGGTSSIRV